MNIGDMDEAARALFDDALRFFHQVDASMRLLGMVRVVVEPELEAERPRWRMIDASTYACAPSLYEGLKAAVPELPAELPELPP